jgi:hypothetical protein
MTTEQKEYLITNIRNMEVANQKTKWAIADELITFIKGLK